MGLANRLEEMRKEGGDKWLSIWNAGGVTNQVHNSCMVIVTYTSYTIHLIYKSRTCKELDAVICVRVHTCMHSGFKLTLNNSVCMLNIVSQVTWPVFLCCKVGKTMILYSLVSSCVGYFDTLVILLCTIG